MISLTKYTAVALVAVGLPTFALADMADIDTNEDGLLSVTEVQAVYPDITAETYSKMDLNADGGLDETEVEAATEAGMMPESPSEG